MDLGNFIRSGSDCPLDSFANDFLSWPILPENHISDWLQCEQDGVVLLIRISNVLGKERIIVLCTPWYYYLVSVHFCLFISHAFPFFPFFFSFYSPLGIIPALNSFLSDVFPNKAPFVLLSNTCVGLCHVIF